jgi:hypothetical protein
MAREELDTDELIDLNSVNLGPGRQTLYGITLSYREGSWYAKNR